MDLINIGIEELIRQCCEIPGFTTLRRTTQRVRVRVNRAIFQHVATALEPEGTGVDPRQMVALGDRYAHPEADTPPGRPAAF